MERDAAGLPSFASSCLAHPVYGDLLRRQTYKTAETVHAQGAPIREFGIVTEGCLKTARYTVDGHELCNGYFEKDDVFPELLYFTGEKVYTYNLLAVRKTTVMWLDTSFFELMLRTDSQMLYRFMLYLSKRGLKNQMLLCCLRYQTIRERIAFWVLWMDDIAQDGCVELPASQTICASPARRSTRRPSAWRSRATSAWTAAGWQCSTGRASSCCSEGGSQRMRRRRSSTRSMSSCWACTPTFW